MGNRPLRVFPVAILVLALAGTQAEVCAQPVHDLTTVRDVRSLSLDQSRKSLPVHLRGVVTVLTGSESSFFVQDETAGISITWSKSSPLVESGQLVEIRGVTTPGMFATDVNASSITILGKGKLPQARLFHLFQLSGGNQDSQFLAIRGIVRSAIVQNIWERSVLVLEIDVGEGNLVTTRIHDFADAAIRSLPGSTVIVHGVCATVYNDKRQFIGIRMHAQSLNEVIVERPAPHDPFAIPFRRLGSLLQFGDREGAISPVKVRGIVTYSNPGHGLYIQEGAEGIFVQSRQAIAVPLGSRVEAVGYPAVGRYSPQLNDAVFRVAGAGPQLAASEQSASAMIVSNDGSPAAPFDSSLVQLKARLVEEVPGVDGDLLVLRDGSSIFSTKLHNSSQMARGLSAGSLLRITGICLANTDETHEARSFEILLRSPSDVVVLQSSSWWTATHASWIAGLLMAVIVAMSGWMLIIRRQDALRVLTVTDSLTALYNRRGFLLLADHQWQLAWRKKKWFLLFYLDVNLFKEINDTMGHKVGDMALQSVADVLRQTFRKTDIIGRLGGDEFAVAAIDYLPESHPALEARLKKALRDHNEGPNGRVKLSLSVGILPCDESIGNVSIEDLLAQADALMYKEKQAGKNRDARSVAGHIAVDLLPGNS